MLAKYQIGELHDTAGFTHYEQQGDKDEFYKEVKKDVHAYFVENKVLTQPTWQLPYHAMVRERVHNVYYLNFCCHILSVLPLLASCQPRTYKEVLLNEVLAQPCRNLLRLQLNPRFSTSMYVKTAAILLTMAGSAYVAFFGTESYAVRALQLLNCFVWCCQT